jgi:hypothetical protein
METSLHRDLKRHYAGAGARTEVVVDRYRIDAVVGRRLIEIQHGSLAAIRTKIGWLVERHSVLVVKPIVASKLIIKHATDGGPVVSQRTSPKRGKLLDIFDELVYFTRVFPHPRLTLEIVLVEIEEFRYPGHGRRRRWRRDDHVVADQRLVKIGASLRLRASRDLLKLLPAALPQEFHTNHLAEHLTINRAAAQRVAYCLREMQAVKTIGKQRNAVLYRLPARRSRKNAAA